MFAVFGRPSARMKQPTVEWDGRDIEYAWLNYNAYTNLVEKHERKWPNGEVTEAGTVIFNWMSEERSVKTWPTLNPLNVDLHVKMEVKFLVF